MKATDSADRNDLFTALAHPVRRQILRAMIARRGDLSPRQVANELGCSMGKVSYHFGVLADCSAIELVRTQPTRGATQHFYRPAIEAEWARRALRVTAWEADGKAPGEETG